MEYDLGSRGLRVVSGRNEDDTGTDSNGAGKSALVMAALWCLTGRSEARTLVGSLTLRECCMLRLLVLLMLTVILRLISVDVAGMI